MNAEQLEQVRALIAKYTETVARLRLDGYPEPVAVLITGRLLADELAPKGVN